MTTPATEQVLAAATGSTGGLGKIATVLASGVIYARLDNTGFGRTDHVTWRVKCNKAHAVQLYRSRTLVDSATITLASMADGETGPILQGLTNIAEDTAASASWAARKYYTGGADDTADAVQLAALLNADYAIVTAGTSVADTDKLVITTDEGAHTIVAAAAADYPNSKYGLNVTAGTELASIILAINHKANVTCASAAAGDTITINKDGKDYVFTGHATTTTAANREWDIADDDTAAAALVTCINDATYGVPGVTASASGAVVSLARDSQADVFTLRSSNSTRLATATAGGVPGVIAAATGATGELSITPVWTKALTVTEAGDQLTVTDIDTPGIYATSELGVVTVVPGTPATGGEKATVIEAQTGTGAGHCACAQTTLASLAKDGSATTGVADNSTTAGTLYDSSCYGWDYLYCGVTNSDGADAATIVVAATVY